MNAPLAAEKKLAVATDQIERVCHATGKGIMTNIRHDILFMALTRPQMFAGVTYTFFVINVIIAVELFLIFRAWWVLVIAVAIHGLGALVSLREPRIFDLWLTKMRNCPRVKNYTIWQCNSYRP